MNWERVRERSEREAEKKERKRIVGSRRKSLKRRLQLVGNLRLFMSLLFPLIQHSGYIYSLEKKIFEWEEKDIFFSLF